MTEDEDKSVIGVFGMGVMGQNLALGLGGGDGGGLGGGGIGGTAF